MAGWPGCPPAERLADHPDGRPPAAVAGPDTDDHALRRDQTAWGPCSPVAADCGNRRSGDQDRAAVEADAADQRMNAAAAAVGQRPAVAIRPPPFAGD